MEKKNFKANKSTSPFDLLDGFPTDRVVCEACGKRHFHDEETFFAFMGNVMVGLHGGIIGNNFSADGTLGRITILCRSLKCLDGILNLVTKEEQQ